MADLSLEVAGGKKDLQSSVGKLWLCGSLSLEVGGVSQSEHCLSAWVQASKQIIEDVEVLLLGTLRDHPGFLQEVFIDFGSSHWVEEEKMFLRLSGADWS